MNAGSRAAFGQEGGIVSEGTRETCPVCRHTGQRGDLFCSKCGAKLPELRPAKREFDPYRAELYAPPPGVNRGKFHRLLTHHIRATTMGGYLAGGSSMSWDEAYELEEQLGLEAAKSAREISDLVSEWENIQMTGGR